MATNTTIPLYALIVEGERQKYFIDALGDYHIEPHTYGFHIKSNNSILDYQKEGLNDLSPEFVREIDTQLKLFSCNDLLSKPFLSKLNINGNNVVYLSDILQQVKNTFQNRNLCYEFLGNTIERNTTSLVKAKIDYISKNLLNVFDVVGPLERLGLYIYLLSTFFDHSERKHCRVLNGTTPDHPIQINISGVDLKYHEFLDGSRYALKQVLGDRI